MTVRASIDGLGTPAPLGLMLPAVFAEDRLIQAFTTGLDEVLAPFHNVLDCLPAYFDPALAPLDFTAWLGGWVGAETEGAAGAGPGAELHGERLREAVALAVTLHRMRGTRRGLAMAVRLAFGVEPEITESGGTAWNGRPLGPVPGDRRPHLTVTVRLPQPDPTAESRLDDLVAAARPAHIPYTVRVTAADGARGADSAQRAAPGSAPGSAHGSAHGED